MDPMLRALLVVSAVTGLLAACGSTPRPPGDARTEAYRTDYDACTSAVPGAVNKHNAKTGLDWFTSPVRRWGQIDDGMSACMAAKGWGRSRACTAEELRAGSAARNLTVGRSGIACTDPATHP